MKLEELVNHLIKITELNITQLSGATGISRQTLNNWKKGHVKSIDPSNIHKLGKAMNKNKWGIQLGNVSNSNIEITTTDSKHKKTGKDLLEENHKLQRLVIKLTEENILLREKLEETKSK